MLAIPVTHFSVRVRYHDTTELGQTNDESNTRSSGGEGLAEGPPRESGSMRFLKHILLHGTC